MESAPARLHTLVDSLVNGPAMAWHTLRIGVPPEQAAVRRMRLVGLGNIIQMRAMVGD